MDKKIARLLVGAGESVPDIRYLTGISTPDDFICFETDGSVTALMSQLEFDRARTCAKPGVAVLLDSEYGNTPAGIIGNFARENGVGSLVLPPQFPVGLAEKLREDGLEFQIFDGTFCPQREFKTPAEAALITSSQRAAEAGFAAAVKLLREASIASGNIILWQGEPLTSELLRAEIDCAILRCGALPTGTICAGGLQSSQPHNSGSGILRAHTPIVMDIFPRNSATGYWGDLTRTVVKGKAPDVVKRAYNAVKDARDRAKELAATGKTGRELHQTAAAVLEKYNFRTGIADGTPYGFIHGLGHGVGLEIHESPRLSPRNPKPLQGGEIFTIEPGVYYPEWGGIRLEDLIYLAPDGTVNCLTAAPDLLEID